jgi:hypothetical protein
MWPVEFEMFRNASLGAEADFFKTLFYFRHTELGAKIIKAHHQFLERFYHQKTSNRIVFESSIAKF